MVEGNNLKILKGAFPDLALGTESGTEFILIRGLALPEGCNPGKLDALLCPTPRDGYPSRLYLEQKISHPGLGTNWNANGVQILGRSWWAVSWKVETSDSPLSILLNHLRAFKR